MTALETHARLHPQRTAIVDAQGRISYAELHDRASRLATRLAHRYGIARGHRVATLLPNSIDHAVLLHALFLLDAVAIPLNTRFTPSELESCLSIAQPLLLAHEGGANSNIAEPEGWRAATARTEFEIGISDRRVIYSEPLSELPPPALPISSSARAPAAILFTSGSSGAPKPVPLTLRNFEAAIAASARHLGVHEDDNWLCPIPLYHVGGISALLRSADAGTCVTLVAGLGAAMLLRYFRDAGITVASLVPTMLRRLLAADPSFRGDTLPALRAILLGGAAADANLLDEAAARALPVLSTYGLTEACSQVATMSLDAPAAKRGSAGRPLDGMRVSIRDDEGTPLPAGTRGAVWIGGANVIDGYLDGQAPERFSDGCFNTGDIGRLDADGFLWIDARREDLIVTGGENVSPAEVEGVLLAHDAVAEACVAGIPDEEWGHAVAAALVLNKKDTDIRNIEAHCRRLLAGYKIPKRWKVLDELPKTEAGKIRRRDVAALLAGGR